MILRILKWVGIALAVVVLVLVGLALWPASTGGLGSTAKPVADYDAAVAEVESIREQEVRDGVIEQCLSRLLTHGEPTERAVVLIHGLTNCPKQWELFGQEAFERGWNVLILRLPEHGLGDRETGKIGSVSHLRHLDAQKLARYADQAVDIGVGLGEKTDVMGLSLGGTVAPGRRRSGTTSTASSSSPRASAPRASRTPGRGRSRICSRTCPTSPSRASAS